MSTSAWRLPVAAAALITASLTIAAQRSPAPPVWGYGGGPEQIRYSPLKQINRANVKQLELAWTYDTGETGAMQTQPLVVGDVLFGYTPSHKTFALDAATGAHLWTFDSGIKSTGPNRGLMYWSSGGERRVFAAVDNFVYALDPATGKPSRPSARPAASTCARTSGAIRRRRPCGSRRRA